MKNEKPRLDIAPHDIMFLESSDAEMTLTSPSRPMVPLPITVRDAPILAVNSSSGSV